MKNKKCIDLNGNICPWMTYDSINFLNSVVKPTHSVFEYGSGNSSLWWSTKLNDGNLHSVEHDKIWYDQFRLPTTKLIEVDSRLNEKHYNCLKEFYSVVEDSSLLAEHWNPAARKKRWWLSMPRKKQIESCHFDQTLPYRSYACEILNHEQQFDIIVVDGMARVLTIWLAIQKLKPDGFIVFDNSDRVKRYAPAFTFLKENDYIEIPFYGNGPINHWKWKTSVFTKNKNILSLAGDAVHNNQKEYKSLDDLI